MKAYIIVSRTVRLALWLSYCSVKLMDRSMINSSDEMPLYLMVPEIFVLGFFFSLPARSFINDVFPQLGGPSNKVILPGRKTPEILFKILRGRVFSDPFRHMILCSSHRALDVVFIHLREATHQEEINQSTSDRWNRRRRPHQCIFFKHKVL